MNRFVAVAIVALLSVAACGGEAEQVTESEASPTAAAPVATARQSTENVLPEEFPDDYPLPEPYTVIYSNWQDPAVTVVFRSEQSSEQIKDFLSARLPEQGWRIIACTTTPNVGTPEATPDPEAEPISVVAAVKDGWIVQTTIGSYEIPNQAFEGPMSFSASAFRTEQEIPVGSPVPCE